MDINDTVYQCDEVRQIRNLHGDLFSEQFRRLPIQDQLQQQAETIYIEHGKRNDAIALHIKCWHPTLVSASTDRILDATFSIDDARTTIAKEYGFADWAEVQRSGKNPPDFEFEAGVDAVVHGDLKTLQDLVEQVPDLTQRRSDYGHRSTLLHYVGSNGVETYRQVVPFNLGEITSFLIEMGADPCATAEMYGGGSTPLALLLSSCHPAAAGVTDEVAEILRSAGKRDDA